VSPAQANPAPVPAAINGDASKPADRVWVHFGANYPQAMLEGRSVIEFDDWHALCVAPCKQYLDAADLEVRVSAPGMTTSNPFRLESGRGRVHFRVSGGSDTVKTLGIAGLTGGIPVMLGGMAMFGYGGISDKDTLRDVGLVTLSVGAAAVIASIPLLLLGTTRVYNAKSDRIATVPEFRF
jgi:hypothetical protein